MHLDADDRRYGDARRRDHGRSAAPFLDNTGTLSVSAWSEIENATVNGGGDIIVTSDLLLDAVTLDSVTVSDFGTLFVIASSEIENATVNGGGYITVISGQTLTLDAVTLDNVTVSGSVSNAATLTIDGDTVTLGGATIIGGTIDDAGTMSVSAWSEIENATVNGGGDIIVTSDPLLDRQTLDSVTVSDFGTLFVIASSEIENAAVNGGGDITVAAGQTLTLDNVTLDGVTLSGNITIDPTVTLDDGTTITGGSTLAIGSGDTLDVERGSGSSGHGATLERDKCHRPRRC